MWLDVLMFGTASAGSFLLTYQRASARRRSPGTTTWPQVDGVVTFSEKRKGNPHIGQVDTTALRYDYKLNGRDYVGSNLTLLDFRADLQWAFINYPVGRKVTVYYNPNRPSECVLEPGTDNEFFGRSVLGEAMFWTSEACTAALGLFLAIMAYQHSATPFTAW